jgi:hypothetical protein
MRLLFDASGSPRHENQNRYQPHAGRRRHRNLPLIVRFDHHIIAAFARLKARQDWASDKSYADENLFVVHAASEVPEIYRNGESLD